MQLMDMWLLFVRTIITYIILFLLMRIMGKREVGKLSLLDLVISFMVAEIGVIVIEDLDRSMWEGIIPMVVLVLIQITTAIMSLRSRKVRLLLDGKPSVIIANGEVYHDIMRKQRYNLDDLMMQLRENQITSIDDVAFAILETSGKLSVIPKDSSAEVEQTIMNIAEQMNLFKGKKQTSDKSKQGSCNMQSNASEQEEEQLNQLLPSGFRFEILPIPLIMDGRVQDENLDKLEKNRFWLKNQLQEYQIYDFKEVFFCSIDHRGQIYVNKNTTRLTKPVSD